MLLILLSPSLLSSNITKLSHRSIFISSLSFYYPSKRERNAPDLPSEGTLGNFVAVLSGHAKLGIQLGPDKVQVDCRSTAHHLCKHRRRKRNEQKSDISHKKKYGDILTTLFNISDVTVVWDLLYCHLLSFRCKMCLLTPTSQLQWQPVQTLDNHPELLPSTRLNMHFFPQYDNTKGTEGPNSAQSFPGMGQCKILPRTAIQYAQD